MAKIYWDAGHGGTDPGAVGHELKEKDLTLKIVNYAVRYLNDNYTGHEQRRSRTGDQTRSLSQRTNDANKWNADVFISVHINAGGGVGYEDFRYNKLNGSSNAGKLQTELNKSIAPLFNRNRGKKSANFYVLRNTNMPAVLTENGFIDNKSDANFFKSDSNLKQIGEAHAKGAAAYLGLKRKKDTPKASGTRRIQTGGLNNENILKVIDFFRTRKPKSWWGQITIDYRFGNPKVTSGGLDESMQKEYQDFLDHENFWYKIL